MQMSSLQAILMHLRGHRMKGVLRHHQCWAAVRVFISRCGLELCNTGTAANRSITPWRRFREEQCKDDIPGGRLAKFHKPLQTPEQRRDADSAAAHAHFCRLGWDPTEVHAGQLDGQLDALLARGRALQAHAKHLENLPEHARAYNAPPTFT